MKNPNDSFPPKIHILSLYFCCLSFFSFAQETVETINLDIIPKGEVTYLNLIMSHENQIAPETIPVMIAKGMKEGPVLGLTSAIHGNELNGIAVVHSIFEKLDPQKMSGIVIGLPVLNPSGFALNQRTEAGGKDLNRIFPGKPDGDFGEKWVWQIKEKILPHFDLMVDMHTASFGNINSYYVRGDLSDETLSKMLFLQGAEIILDNEGTASAGVDASSKTMRAEAVEMGIKAITVEYGNPQVFQEDMIHHGINGVSNLINWLGIQEFGEIKFENQPILCSSSHWLYTDEGGILSVKVSLGQIIEEGQEIASISDLFGRPVKSYYSEKKGVVIGKSANPVAKNGSRILHLGILAPD